MGLDVNDFNEEELLAQELEKNEHKTRMDPLPSGFEEQYIEHAPTSLINKTVC
jgi:hypothetical protein